MTDAFAGAWGPLLIFTLRIFDVSLATMRVVTIVRGPRWLAPVLSFFESTLWIVAVAAAIQNLTSPLHVIGYAGGYSAGTAVGMWVEGRLAFGWGVVRTFSRGGDGLARALRAEGFTVTEQEGMGRSGPVTVLYTVVRRRLVPNVLHIVGESDPDAFVTVQTDAAVRRGFVGSPRRA